MYANFCIHDIVPGAQATKEHPNYDTSKAVSIVSGSNSCFGLLTIPLFFQVFLMKVTVIAIFFTRIYVGSLIVSRGIL